MKNNLTNTIAIYCSIVFGIFLSSEVKAQDCLNPDAFSAVDVSILANQIDTITTCVFHGEYTPVSNVTDGANLNFAQPDGGYVTVREGSFDGSVVAQGSGSATVFNASGLDLFVHWNIDSNCGIDIGPCTIATVQCLNCDGCLSLSLFETNDLSSKGPDLVTFSTCNFVGEYNELWGVPAFETIEFTADEAYITVRQGTPDGPIVGEGFSPVSVFSGSGDNLFSHYSSDAACGIEGQGDICLETTVQCTTCPFPDPMDGDCFNPNEFGSVDISEATNDSVVISNCNFTGEHSEVTGISAEEDIQFSVAEGSYITVREGTPNGAVVAQGFSPVTVVSASGANLYAHWTLSAACGESFDCIQTFVQCISCPACPDGSNPGDVCDDGNPATTGSTVQEDCSCSGGGIIPANTNCNGISEFLGCGESVSGSTEFATPAINTVSGCGFIPNGTNDVWYAFQANGSDNYIVNLDEGEFFDGVIYVYSGICAALTEIGCSDEVGSGGSESVQLDGLNAGIYYIQLYDFIGTGEYTVSLECASSCANPFPAIDPASLTTTQIGNGFLTEWDAAVNQIGCQIQARLAGGPGILGSIVVPGVDAESFVIPLSVLQPNTDYQWRVRCGCSQTPLVAGPWSAWQPFSTPGSAVSSLPNPTEGQSNVTFTVLKDGYTTLEVFDMNGRTIDAVFTGVAQANNDYRFEFDGSALPNGVYLYRLTTENEVINDKFMIAM